MRYRNDRKRICTGFCGNGEGKSSAAIGKGILSAIDGNQVIVVQFMKEKNDNESRFFNV